MAREVKLARVPYAPRRASASFRLGMSCRVSFAGGVRTKLARAPYAPSPRMRGRCAWSPRPIFVRTPRAIHAPAKPPVFRRPSGDYRIFGEQITDRSTVTSTCSMAGEAP